MAKIRVNGREIEAPEGANLLQAVLDAGVFVPHYCYHPGLSPEGNCRMCMVKVSGSRKLEPICMWKVKDGLEVVTEDPEVAAARRHVLEYMLINHPVDCPICDKAGECMLQDFTYNYRGGLSRFPHEDKVIKHTKDLGPEIRIWGNRCIVCSLCVRFCGEIAGTAELTIVQRGDRSVVDTFPGIPIGNPMSLNVVDICPVGALIDKDFLYQARVWYARETKTTCPSCSRGCAVRVTTLENEIKRVVPRYHPQVNGYWMCDEGRRNVKYIRSPRRMVEPRGSLEELRERMRDARDGWGLVVSTYNTLEEMWLVRRLAQALSAPVGFLTDVRGERWTARNGFTIEPDRTPNSAGARLVFGEGAPEAGLGPVRGRRRLLVINGIPRDGWPAELEEIVAASEVCAVCELMRTALAERAQLAVPALSFAEKDGTVVSFLRRISRLRRAIEPPETIVPETEWLQELLVGLGERGQVMSAEGVFREMAGAIDALNGLTWAAIGDMGRALP